MTSITAPTAPTAADFAAAGVVLSDADYARVTEWRAFCPFEGCVCEKYADCDYCEACTGGFEQAEREYQQRVEAERVEALPFGAFLFGEPTDDDRYDL